MADIRPAIVASLAGLLVWFSATNEAEGCASDLGNVVNFEFSKAEITPSSAPWSKLDRIIDWMKVHPTHSITVEGQVDSAEPETLDLELSKLRAVAVRDLLIRRGLLSSQLLVEAGGSKRPGLPHCSTEECHAFNRRVLLRVPIELENEFSPCPGVD